MIDYDFRIQEDPSPLSSLIFLHPATEAAQEWVNDHLDPDHQTWAGGVVIEKRYFGDIINAIWAEGFSIKTESGLIIQEEGN